MMFSSFATLALLSSAVSAYPSEFLDERQVTTSSDCPTADGVHVIAVSGANVPYEGEGSYGRLGNLSTSILDAIPGSTTAQVPYNKNFTSGGLMYLTAGSVTFTEYVDDFHASCPCSKVVVIGYSGGAIITLNALCGASAPWTVPASGFNSSYTDFIVGVIEYGDETRTASAPYNLGTCYNGGTHPRTAANAACPIFASRMQSYCDYSDPDCCLGTILETHFIYDQKYDANSTAFIVEQNDAFGSVCSSSNSTTSSSSSTRTSSSSSASSTVVLATTSSSSTTRSTSATSTTTSVASTSSSASASSTSSASSTTSASSTASPVAKSSDSSTFTASIPRWLATLYAVTAIAVFGFLV